MISNKRTKNRRIIARHNENPEKKEYIPITRSKTPFLKTATKNAEKPCVSRVFGVF